MKSILSNSKETICLSAILCLFFPFILSSAAGSDWPDCNFHCRANLAPLTQASQLLEELGSFWRNRLENLETFLTASPTNSKTTQQEKRRK